MALFTGAFFVAQVSLIIVAKPFYAIFCTSSVPHHEIRGLSLARSWRMLTMVDNSLRWLTKNGRNEGELTPKY